MRAEIIGSNAKQSRDTKTTIVTTSSLAKKTRDSTAGTDRACSNERSGENKHSNGTPESADRVCT